MLGIQQLSQSCSDSDLTELLNMTDQEWMAQSQANHKFHLLC